MYDYLIVGAGLLGAIFAHEATKQGKKVKVIDKRDHISGTVVRILGQILKKILNNLNMIKSRGIYFQENLT